MDMKTFHRQTVESIRMEEQAILDSGQAGAVSDSARKMVLLCDAVLYVYGDPSEDAGPAKIDTAAFEAGKQR